MINLEKKLVLLDRDGVINQDRHDYVTKPEELVLLSNALRAIGMLTKAGIRVGICTNQSGIERGRYTVEMLAKIHQKLREQAAVFGGEIERIVYCDTYDDNHPWRKPNPGMLLDQAVYFKEDLAGVPFVGDNYIDVEAARRAGAEPVLVKAGKGREVAHKRRAELEGVSIYPNLEEAVKDWLK